MAWEVEVEISQELEVEVELCAPVVIQDGFTPITLRNSDGSVEITINEPPSGGVYVLADITHFNSDGSSVTVPAQVAFSAGICEVFTNPSYSNSSKSFVGSLESGAILNIPDSVITQVDGSVANNPATEPFTCVFSEISFRSSDNQEQFTLSSFPVAGVVVLSDIQVTDPDGSVRTIPFSDEVTCQFPSLELINSIGDVLQNVNSYPPAGKVLLADVEHTDSDGSPVTLPAGKAMVCSTVVAASIVRDNIPHRPPAYSQELAGDYRFLWDQGTFDVFKPNGPVQLKKLNGNDPFTLHPDNPNPWGGFARYTSRDGTPSDPGAATFSGGYGSVAPEEENLVIDWLYEIEFCNLFLQSSGGGEEALSINDAITRIHVTENANNFGNRSDWICPSRDMVTMVCFPDNDSDLHESPNPIISSGTRRVATCERLPSRNSAYGIFMGGSEFYQSPTSTISGQTRALIMRFVTAADISAWTA